MTLPVLTFRSCRVNEVKRCSAPTETSSERDNCTYLHVDLVAAENNGNVLANTLKITVPVGDILVGNAGGNIEHDDTALALNVVTIAETTELLLTGGIPDVEADRAEVGGERERVDLDTEGGCTMVATRSGSVRGSRRDSNAYQCTSSRIHRSSGANKERKISTRSRSNRRDKCWDAP